MFEDGVFRPTEKVEFPDPCEVEIEVRQVTQATRVPSLEEVYEILERRHTTGEHDLAERH